MITYLKAGWHTRPGQLRLRSDVMDGAIDSASMLFRSGVPPEALLRLALKVRNLTTFIQPVMRLTVGSGKFSARERAILEKRLSTYTDRFPPLQGFLHDCFEHIRTTGELRALYLHLIHVSQMMQLLRVAKVVSQPRAKAARPTAASATRKAPARKAPARKKAPAKPRTRRP